MLSKNSQNSSSSSSFSSRRDPKGKGKVSSASNPRKVPESITLKNGQQIETAPYLALMAKKLS